MNQYIQKSVGEEIERKYKVLHLPTDEIRSSSAFFQHLFDSLCPEEIGSPFSAKSRFIQQVHSSSPVVPPLFVPPLHGKPVSDSRRPKLNEFFNNPFLKSRERKPE